MRHIETIKSVVLLLLVLLSLILTFLIWTYTPNFQIIEEPEVEQITIGSPKEVKDVVKPHRILVRSNNNWIGTHDTKPIDLMMNNLSKWKGSELTFIRGNLTDADINELLSANERMTLHFHEEVPIRVFSSVLSFSQTELPEVTFNQLILDVNKIQNNTLQIYFVSEQNRTLYITNVSIVEPEFQSVLNNVIQDFISYEEIKRNNKLSLYVPKEKVELVKYTYVINEISPDLLKEALFIDPTIVQKNAENADSMKYTDGMYLMTVDQPNKIINYVYPASESIAPISPSQLLEESFEFINEHGGFTDDFRFASMNVSKHLTEYQLYKQGYPVFSNITTTRISTTWGEKEIFRYKRPYYLFDMDFPDVQASYQLPSGLDVINTINQSNLSLEDIEDIVLGYYLIEMDNNKNLLYTLEPSWFAIQGGNGIKLTSEKLGGTENGLE